MAKEIKRKCPQCRELKSFRADQKTCGCKPVKPELSEVNEISGDKWNISLPKTRIHTLEELIEYFKIDLTEWEVERFVANKWEMGAKNANDELVIEPLYQIKAFLKKKVAVVAAKKEIEELKELAKREIKLRPRAPIKVQSTGHMLEINIPDLHVAKLAWGQETGYGNYDSQIATELYDNALDTLLQRTSGTKFELILLVVGNDLFHSDTPENATFKGTRLDTDSRYHKSFGLVRTMMIRAIERLRKIAPVKVVMVSGNHDTMSVWHLGDSLECYFHGEPDIEIDNSPKFRKYHQFGKVMLMFTHGHKGKRLDYPLLMATEQPDMFGATKFREAHTGHLHTTKTEEAHGVRIRVLPALCEADAWHSEHTFTGNIRAAEAYEWHQEEGLIGMAFFNAVPPENK